jgi:LysR family transcriptional regulator, transcriptional activator of the cysJI operon
MSIYKANSIFHRLDLSLLRHFFAIATFGGFSKASRATGISQPALSLGLQKLEKTLGVSLVDRKSRDFALTKAGLTLLTFCQRLEGTLESVVGDLDANLGAVRRRLRIGTALSIGFSPLMDVCLANSGNKDPYEIELSAQNTYQLLNDLVEGTLDAALVPSEVYDTRLKFSRLFQDEVAFVYGSPLKKYFSEGSWSTSLKEISLVNYPRETPMRSLVEKICVEGDLQFRSMLSVNGIDAIKSFVERGVGGAFVLRSLVSAELKEKSLFEAKTKKKLPSIGVAIATTPNEHGDEIVKILKSLYRK